MSYTEIGWEDSPSTKTPVNASNLNKMDKQIKEIADYVDDMKSNLIDMIYPVGSIYMSVNNVSPATFMGGSWTQIKDTFLLAAGSTYSAGATGGEATHTITTAEMPSHTHTFTGSAVNTGNQSANHTHSIPALSGTAASTTSSWTVGHMSKGSGAGTNTTISQSLGTEMYGSGGSYMWSTTYTNKHTHSVSTTASTTGKNSVNHTHSVTAAGTNSNTGSGTAMNNMPPYLSVYMWKRVA